MFTEREFVMRPRTKSTTQFTIGFALCSALLSSCASNGYAQGMSSPRVPARARYANTLPDPESLPSIHSLEAIQSQAAPAAAVKSPAGTISVRELRVPAGAIKEFQRSEKAVHSGDFQSAAEHLRKAIQIDPNFVQAHNNLGASYIELNECESAVTEFRKAIDLDSKLQESYRNLGLALFLLRRYPEAEIAARQALQLDPQRSSARYTLGRILAAEGSGSAEAEELLRQCVPEYVDARLPLAQVLLNRGATEQSANELRAYMRSPGANQASMASVQYWLSKITQAKVAAPSPGSEPGL
jgi:tetratricopeptide (TPR) repeat protein